ncbi:UNVERIFIED_CONTAM: hypothetical protein Slati_2215000 [Sesamum latifolium]|uniref:DUF4283 domain-containing protein n=1 Tax=Sesamum latifolium TaxID=2727402 RepID=A0AAW2WU37_9LAMI
MLKVQTPPASHFQHDPVCAAKKTFQDDEIHMIGSCSCYKGEPGITYSNEETEKLAIRLKFALVGKFSYGLPNMNFLQQRIIKLGLRGSATVARLSLKHVLINLTHDEDFSRICLRGEWTFDGFHMRVFKWDPCFDPQTESSIATSGLNSLGFLAICLRNMLCLALHRRLPLGHENNSCLAKNRIENSQPDLEHRTNENQTLHATENEDLWDVLNKKRKGKDVIHVNDPVNCLSLDANTHTLEVSIAANTTAAFNDKPGIIENVYVTAFE